MRSPLPSPRPRKVSCTAAGFRPHRRTEAGTPRVRSRVRYHVNRRAGGLEAVRHEIPVRRREKGVDVIPALRAVIGHERMLEDVHQEKHRAAGELATIVLVDPDVEEAARSRVPDVEEAARSRVPDERGPADSPQASGRAKLLLPRLVRTEIAADLRPEAGSLFQIRPLFCQICKIHLVEPHSVPLPAEAPLEL